MEHAKYKHSFDRARSQADLEQIWARLAGKSIDLLSFDEVRRRLKAELTARRTRKEIPLAAIVGSVGRPGDYTRDFRPLNDRDAYRWAEVRLRADHPAGLPPIEVYQVGEAYFVLDGNHRVSVARQLGATHIEAYVTEVRSRVPLTAEADARELILKERHVAFLEHTGLDRLRPDADLQLTQLGRYAELEHHISLHRHVLQVAGQREVPLAEAVADWYDQVYMPVVRAIRDLDALKDFPRRTEADLYLAISGYRALLQEWQDWELDLADAGVEPQAGAAAHLPGFVGRVVDRLRQVRPGDWRRGHFQADTSGPLPEDVRLFTSLLVPVTSDVADWAPPLDLALAVAHRERGRVLGLYVLPDLPADGDPEVAGLREEFERRCLAAGVVGRLAVQAGEVAQAICERSAWVDMTVVRLAHLPPTEAWARLSSGFRTLVRDCASALLAVPAAAQAPRLGRAVLGYNGSPKADGALQVAAYLSARWSVALTVVTAARGGLDAATTLARAEQQLAARGVSAQCLLRTGPAAETVLAVADEQASDFIIVGGYGRGPFLEIALGSTVDHVLRLSRRPTLICP